MRKYIHPTIDTRNSALIARSGVYDGENFHDFDQSPFEKIIRILSMKERAHIIHLKDLQIHLIHKKG